MPGERLYYSQRAGNTKLTLDAVLRLFLNLYETLDEGHYWDEAFGYDCVDQGYVPGSLGAKPENAITLRLRKDHIWPIPVMASIYSDEDLFDVIELLFDLISEPREGYHHSYADCGWHYAVFDQHAGQDRFRAEINRLLADYADGFELSEAGEVLTLAPSGMGKLLAQPIPETGPPNVGRRIDLAVKKFRRHGATSEHKRDAVRDLADILEYVRPDIKGVISRADENDLFNLANNFTIRHFNPSQKSDYDEGIWLTWMFYTKLNMLHVCLRLLARKEKSAQSTGL